MAYSGPESPGAAPASWRWLAAVLDEVDFGLIVVADRARVLYANRAATNELDDRHPLELNGDELRSRHAQDAATLRAALQDAGRGLRKLLTLDRVAVSVVPLGALDDRGAAATLVMLGRRAVVGDLAVQGFARSHGLTAGETRVLTALCRGVRPIQIALDHAVAISTVRTQIGAIRAKTGAASIRDLVGQAATLPPLMTVLRQGMATRGAPLFSAAT